MGLHIFFKKAIANLDWFTFPTPFKFRVSFSSSSDPLWLTSALHQLSSLHKPFVLTASEESSDSSVVIFQLEVSEGWQYLPAFFPFIYFYFMPNVHGGQKRTLDPLKLEVLMAVSHHLSAGNQIWALCKNKSLNCCTEWSLQPYLHIILVCPFKPLYFLFVLAFLFVSVFYLYLVCFNFWFSPDDLL